ncbi:lectin, galactoside-binding, soluble, 2b [Tachysurus fulvidraco]|uniref:lectin, galactoside-binding, soluble, 2b n=1 Tax=Tachysurus fulvidraco TaxID=1234273 RepID=UPI000F4DF3AC|nr:lectin, galactoside-binding, soluble, 2b [Tachysurus fulvidraco]
MVFTVKDMTFKAGQELTISGKPKSDCNLFSINIGHDSDNIALHFNPRFNHEGDSNTIVFNSNRGGWGEEVREHSFPFDQGESFKVVFSFNNEQFYIKLPNGTMTSFPNRFGDDAFKHIDVQGDVKVLSIKIK